MSHINSQKWLIDRRRVLRGVGASIALPMLSCMQPTRAVADQKPNTAKPKRSVFIYVPNGVNTLTWQIEQSGPRYKLPQPLQSLAEHRKQLTPISGLHHPHAIGKAHQCEKIWLTAANMGEKRSEFRNSISADQLMAEKLGSTTRFSSLELAITGGTLAWSRDGVALPAERKPSVVFERLFGKRKGGIASARQKLTTQKSVLDLVLEDAQNFRKTIGREDKRKLDEYLNAVREVELRTERADAWLSTPKPTVESKIKNRLTRNMNDAQAGDYYRTVYDLMVLALRTDMTRVITCMSGSEGRGLALPEIGIKQGRHELSHHNGDPQVMNRLTRCDTFLVQQFSYFLKQLKNYEESGETLLDRTMVLFGSGMSYGHSHGNANLPMILAGGSALGIKHGNHIDYNLPKIKKYSLTTPQNHYKICMRPVDSDARVSNLLLTMLRCMDVKAKKFGDSTEVISEILSQ